MSRQMPELYLRGAIFNETMKNLSQKQIDTVEAKIEILMKTPSLTKSREKFCQTLAGTIGADYREDKNAALQEYNIALMKAVIYVLYHKPNHQVFDDPIQTRKLFSQFTYNYMKQILNENKIPKSVYDRHIEDEPYVVAYEQVMNILDKEGVFHVGEFHDESFIIEGDIGIISMSVAKKIGKLRDSYVKMGVNITANIQQIEIKKLKSAPNVRARLRSDSRIHVVTFEHETDKTDNDSSQNRYNIEYEISQKRHKKPSGFDPSQMRNMLPDHLTEIFDIIIDTPDELGKEPNKNEIAKCLKISINEVNRRLHQMKYYYYAAKA
jgi:hypothetical protein